MATKKSAKAKAISTYAKAAKAVKARKKRASSYGVGKSIRRKNPKG